ncbi:M57 family metalloprotease [Aquimarina aquimarini]|uniref:M57 family metalloprotease n=1 Tax=Aquimarina aquimarini TaxID=1191734 RepID=UPI001F2B55F2|nr:M57 family metalloprotease [Aquimarina aquimarini]
MKTRIFKHKTTLLSAIMLVVILFASCEKNKLETEVFEQQETIQKRNRDIYFGEPSNTLKRQDFVGFAGVFEVRDIKVFLNNNVPQEWMVPTQNAINQWNSSSPGISMSRTTNRGEADIVISGEAEVGFDFSPAGADFPEVAGGAVGAFVTINLNYNPATNGPLSNGRRFLVMTHELGHNIGFQHSDQGRVSFMRNGFLPGDDNWAGMTQQDRNAITAQFPDIAAR